jgi:hypothetical protein
MPPPRQLHEALHQADSAIGNQRHQRGGNRAGKNDIVIDHR